MIPDATPAAADCVLELIRRPERWLRRRTDEAQLLDPTRIDWTTRVEVSIPDLSSVQRGVQVPVLVLPLFRKKRGVSRGFLVSDSSGHVIPHLTLDENVAWTQALVVRAAEQSIPGGRLEPRVADLLRSVGGGDVGGSGEALQNVMAWALQGAGSTRTAEQPYATVLAQTSPAPDEAAQASRIVQDTFAAELLAATTGGYYVLVPAANTAGDDLVFTITHEDVLSRDPDDDGDRCVVFPVGSAKSYHANLSLPNGVALRPPLDFDGAILGGDHDETRRLAVYASMAPASAVARWNGVRKGLCLGEGSLRWPARLLALAALMVFLAGFGLRIAGAHPAAGSAPLLVVAVSLAAGLALQRYDWRVQVAVSRNALVVLLLVMLAAAVGAGALAVDWPVHAVVTVHGQHLGWKSVVWTAGALVALAATLLALRAWVKGR